MKTLIAAAALAALSLTACSTFQAKSGPHTYTCIPNDPQDRGPFVATPAPGEKVVVTGSPEHDTRVAGK